MADSVDVKIDSSSQSAVATTTDDRTPEKTSTVDKTTATNVGLEAANNAKSEEESAIEEAARQEILETLSAVGGVAAVADELPMNNESPELENGVEANKTPSSVVDGATATPSPSEIDNNLIDIINSMEADRQKFLTHVRSKISNQETEFEVRRNFLKE